MQSCLFKEIKKVTGRVTILKEAASDMLQKLNFYYQEALSKNVFIIAAILDLRIKTNFLKGKVGILFVAFHAHLFFMVVFFKNLDFSNRKFSNGGRQI
jgi:hypothetical protein